MRNLILFGSVRLTSFLKRIEIWAAELTLCFSSPVPGPKELWNSSDRLQRQQKIMCTTGKEALTMVQPHLQS